MTEVQMTYRAMFFSSRKTRFSFFTTGRHGRCLQTEVLFNSPPHVLFLPFASETLTWNRAAKALQTAKTTTRKFHLLKIHFRNENIRVGLHIDLLLMIRCRSLTRAGVKHGL